MTETPRLVDQHIANIREANPRGWQKIVSARATALYEREKARRPEGATSPLEQKGLISRKEFVTKRLVPFFVALGAVTAPPACVALYSFFRSLQEGPAEQLPRPVAYEPPVQSVPGKKEIEEIKLSEQIVAHKNETVLPQTKPLTVTVPVPAEEIEQRLDPTLVPTATKKPPIPALLSVEDRASVIVAQYPNKVVGKYAISSGDSLSSIARKLGVSQQLLIEVNGITDPGRIRAGDILVYPADHPTPTPIIIEKTPTPVSPKKPAVVTPIPVVESQPTTAKEPTAMPTKQATPTVETVKSRNRIIQGDQAAKNWIAGPVSNFFKDGRVATGLVSAIEVGGTKIDEVLPISLNFSRLPWLTKSIVKGAVALAGFKFDETQSLSFLAAVTTNSNFNLPPLPAMPDDSRIGVNQDSVPGLGEIKMIVYAPLDQEGLTTGARRVAFLVGSRSGVNVRGGNVSLASVDFSRFKEMTSSEESAEACQRLIEAQKQGKGIVFTAAFDFSGKVLRTVWG